MNEPPVERIRPMVNWLRRQQEYSGGWSFSGHESEEIIYLPYILLTFQLYEEATDDNVDETLRNALSYVEGYTPQNNIEQIIRTWCVNKLDDGNDPSEPSPEPDYTAIIQDEFANYIIHEHL